MKFEIDSEYSPAGDQVKAIKELGDSIASGNRYQTLLGVTGSGKTFTMANIIQKLQMPTLIMTHNKTLAAQLYSEFKNFFPKNRVEYFISNFDYYQPEAYIPRQDLFIDKDSSVNDELERLRLSATTSLLGHDDVIVIASVSANYGLGSAEEFAKTILTLKIGSEISQKDLILNIVDMGYTRNDAYFDRGNFRVNGDVVDIYPAYSEDMAIRIEFFGDEIESIVTFDYIENRKIDSVDSEYTLYAANQFIVSQERQREAINSIEKELAERLAYLKSENMDVEYSRLRNRTDYDLEMIKENGVCKGIENYSRHLTGKKAGETPSSLHDYFAYKKKPYLIIVDESHVSLPQFGGMYAGDRSRKTVLVDYGFRLPSALDNRPLMYEEFIDKAPNYLFVSATPNERELALSSVVSEQVIRPTGLLDPVIEIKDSENQVEVLHDEMKAVIDKGFRILITTLTKKMAEDLTTYYNDLGVKTRYMHSDIDAIERNDIIRGLRAGEFDVLVGINLLREGLDLPEVALVAIMDADKEGFLRSETSLIQTIGRAARNSESKVILFARRITKSMQSAIDITNKRREVQDTFNKEHGIVPKTVIRKIEDKLEADKSLSDKNFKYDKKDKLPKEEKQKLIKELTKKMHENAKILEFEEAVRLRDEIAKIRKDL